MPGSPGAPVGTPEGNPLLAFFVRRLLQAVIVILIVTMITFALLRAIPGNVAIAILGPTAYKNPATIAQFDAQYGFNKPWFDQYFLWLGHLAQGNLGYSWKLNQSVASLLGNHLPKTIILVGISTVIALAVAIPIGVWQAVRRNKAVDYTFTGLLLPVLRGAGVLRRDRPDHDLRRPDAHLRRRGPAGRPGQRLHGLEGPDPARRHPGPGDVRAVQPVHAVGGAGQHHRGLRAHSPGQGRLGTPCAHPARAAQLADPDRDAGRAQHPGHRGGRAHHRAGFQLPGYGVPVLPGCAEPGLPHSSSAS